MIDVNTTLVHWFSKKQSTVETSVFYVEFITMKQGIDVLGGLRYKLRMMSILTSGPSFIYGDNMSVVCNTSRPEPVLKKKSNSVCYHTVHQSVAMKESLVGHMPSKENVTDMMRKVLSGQKRNFWLAMFFMILSQCRTQSGKFDLIGNHIKLEGTLALNFEDPLIFDAPAIGGRKTFKHL